MIKIESPDQVAIAKEVCFLMVTHEPRGAEEQALKRLDPFVLEEYKTWIRTALPGTIKACNSLVPLVSTGTEQPSRGYFLKCVDDQGNYRTGALAAALSVMTEIRRADPKNKTMRRLVMIGLPGKDNTQREEARDDLNRWFKNEENPVTDDEVNLVILREEALGT